MDQAQQGIQRGMDSLLRLGDKVRQYTAEIRVLNNRHLGTAIRSGNGDQITREAKTLIVTIHEALTQVQSVWSDMAKPESV